MAYDKVIDSAELDAGMTATADAIRNKTGGSAPIAWEPGTGFKAAVDGIQAGGGENPLDYASSIYKAFSDARMDNLDLVVSFGAKSRTPMQNDALYATFANARGLKSIKVIWEGVATTSGLSLFNFARISNGAADTTLEILDLSGVQNSLYVTSMNRCFENRKALREILGELDVTNCTAMGSFCTGCNALETIRFKSGTIKLSTSFAYSPLLTDETIQNIIDGLADLTGGTAQTLTLHADVGAKLTDTQKSAASAKNWTISY